MMMGSGFAKYTSESGVEMPQYEGAFFYAIQEAHKGDGTKTDIKGS